MLRTTPSSATWSRSSARTTSTPTPTRRSSRRSSPSTTQGGKPVDLVILAEAAASCAASSRTSAATAYLAELWDAAPTAANAEYYAQIVRDKALVRNLIRRRHRDPRRRLRPDDAGRGVGRSRPSDDVRDRVEGGTGERCTTLEQAITETYDRIDKRTSGSELAFSGLSTGFTDLNELTAGLQRVELIIIAARPSVGKTAFALAWCATSSSTRRSRSSSSAWSSRGSSSPSACCAARPRSIATASARGRLTGDDMEKLIEAGSVLRTAKLFIDDTPAQGMLRIAANARRLKRQHDIKLVVIDYLQLIEPDNRRDPRQEQVAQISRRLKFLARELEIPVIALAQVNRASEDRQDHRPRLSRSAGSGLSHRRHARSARRHRAARADEELVGRSGFRVWSLNEQTMRLDAAEVTNAFSTGRKPVFRLTTRLGRTIRATANHPFRAFDGWKRLDELRVGAQLGTPDDAACYELVGFRVAGVEDPGALLLLTPEGGDWRLHGPSGASASDRCCSTSSAHVHDHG